MKRRHSGIISLLILFIALGTAGVFMVFFWEKKPERSRIRPLRPMPTIAVPSPDAIKEIQNLETRLSSLAFPTKPAADGVKLNILTGEKLQKLEGNESAENTQKSPKPVLMNYSLTLAFSSANSKFCYINDSFLREGGLLPDNAKIITIEPDRVLIRKKDIEKWIHIKEEEIRKNRNS